MHETSRERGEKIEPTESDFASNGMRSARLNAVYPAARLISAVWLVSCDGTCDCGDCPLFMPTLERVLFVCLFQNGNYVSH